MNLLVDLGGIMKSIISVLSIINYPISWFLYTLKSIKRLFFVITLEKNLFNKQKKINSK
jgi:hypothetical protein